MHTILITGGTGGLGHAVVARLSRDYRCVVLYRSAGAWHLLHEQVPAAEGIASLESNASVAPLYALIHLAGAFEAGAGPDAFARMFESNAMSVARAYEAAAPHLSEGGRVVAISSAASLAHPPGLAAYNSSKAALNAFILTIARDLAPRRITANALLPTALATPAMRNSAAGEDLVPLERVGEWIGFLLSEHGSGVTGQLIALSA
jgi:NAD(P)-dependent dehydrogenase (short-subunit alcohol dehydrogenase family)